MVGPWDPFLFRVMETPGTSKSEEELPKEGIYSMESGFVCFFFFSWLLSQVVIATRCVEFFTKEIPTGDSVLKVGNTKATVAT